VSGVVAITTALIPGQQEASFRAVKDILGILLPVLSGWAGTVFAFFFGRENFEAAARTSAALVRQLSHEEKLRSIPLKQVMIPIDKATKLTLDRAENLIKLKADIIDAILEKEKRERLPMLDPQGRIKFMAHRSLIDKFIVQETTPPKTKTADQLTLADMLADAPTKEILAGSFQTLHETSNLAEAKTLIDKIKICSDIFATEDGTPNTKVLGWVTNVIVREQSVV
jgi:hypothetical protein